jgi:hypothetical protein
MARSSIFDLRSSIFFISLFLFVEQTAFREVLTGYAETHPGQRLQSLRADLFLAVGANAILLVPDALKSFLNLREDLPVVGRLAEEQLLRV